MNKRKSLHPTHTISNSKETSGNITHQAINTFKAKPQQLGKQHKQRSTTAPQKKKVTKPQTQQAAVIQHAQSSKPLEILPPITTA